MQSVAYLGFCKGEHVRQSGRRKSSSGVQGQSSSSESGDFVRPSEADDILQISVSLLGGAFVKDLKHLLCINGDCSIFVTVG